MTQSTAVSAEDLEHAHRLVDRLDSAQMYKALCVARKHHRRRAVYVTSISNEDETIDAEENEAAAQGRKDLAEGRTSSMDEVLGDMGLSMADLENIPEPPHLKDSHGVA